MPVTGAHPLAPVDERAGGGRPDGRTELVAGVVLLAVSLVAALIVYRFPGPNALDRWGFRLFPVARRSSWMTSVTEAGTLPVLVLGSALAAVVVLPRDRWRALACLVGPAAASATVEWIVKPAVDRHLAGALTFPSGHVTVVASLGTAWVLAVPHWLRLPTAAVAAVAVTLMAVSVVKLGWHYPSDTFAGASFGAGIVLTFDGLLHMSVGPGSTRPSIWHR